MLRTLFVATLLSSSLVYAAPAPAKIDPQKAADIRAYMKLTGVGDVGKQVLAQIIVSMRRQLPSAPPELWTELEKQVNADELLELLVPVYDKHFSDEDLKVLIAFYQTPTGKRFVHELPGITQDSMAIGSEWGRKIGERVIEQAKKKQSTAK